MRKIDIEINRAELLGKVSQWSYALGENIGDDAVKRRHFVQGALDRGHASLIEARLDEAWSVLLMRLSAYTVPRCEACHSTPTGDGEQAGDLPDWTVSLSFPDDTYPDLGDNIRRLCERYLTLQARAEWERLTHQDENDCVSEAQSEQTLRRLKVVINARSKTHKLRNYGWR